MSETKNPAFLQGATNLQSAASLADAPFGTAQAPPIPAQSTLRVSVKAIAAKASRTPPSHSCCNRLKLTFYFDGTGNNLNADLPKLKHSNVGRMFAIAEDDNDQSYTFSYYVPGLGTYFPDIGDLGDSTGKAFGRRGEQRLDWAMGKLQKHRALTPKLIGIDIALIGFSRGAALARAFANRIQQICEPGRDSAGWALKGTSISVDIYFMGLWDTVASVGLPKSVNNQSLLGLVVSGALTDREPPALRMLERDVALIAYGRPGADPAQQSLWSWGEGHAGWGAEMSIPPIVSHGVHMLAGHEIRNSFPVDTVMQGTRRSPAFEGREYVYPGAHSDVGGGYRPGEGGRSWPKGAEMSLIPLRAMYDAARSRGVPLKNLKDASFVVSQIRLYFAVALPADPEENHAAARQYDESLRLWNRYLDHCGRSSRPIGQWFLAHMKAYYAWRFRNIKKNRAARASHQPTDDERQVLLSEEQSEREGADLDRRIAVEEQASSVQDARKQSANARSKLLQSRQKLLLGQNSAVSWMSPMNATQAQEALASRRRLESDLAEEVASAEREVAATEQAQAVAEDPLHRLQAQKAALPSHGTLARNWRNYDDRLYADAKQLADNKALKPYLRPHYRALVQAWEDEFIHHRGLTDADVTKFFETYVHDSLADFGLDATLPSDPRVVYVGGDEIEHFALLQAAPSREAVQAV